MANLKGIDVSKHNGVIDWEAVKASGKVEFAITRAGYTLASAAITIVSQKN